MTSYEMPKLKEEIKWEEIQTEWWYNYRYHYKRENTIQQLLYIPKIIITVEVGEYHVRHVASLNQQRLTYKILSYKN